VFTDVPPPGTGFMAGSTTVDGLATAGDPNAGINIGTVAAGTSRSVAFKVTVNSIPAAPTLAVYSNSAAWAYQFISCSGQPSTSGTVTTSAVTTSIARLTLTKIVAPAGTVTPGTTLTYTVTLNNDGSANSSGTTLQDTIPAGVTYVPGSTALNGVAGPDVAGAMPFTTANAINSPGQAAGVLTAGATATLSFVVTVNNNATATITNTATGDIDGTGAAPAQTATVTTPIQRIAKLTINKTNGVDTLVAGQTTSYTITVANFGPSDADGAVVTDPPAAGLSCTSVLCNVASGTATCPAALTLTTFQAGVAIPAFPANSSVVFLLECGVTATGM
jgi:large repetitive protein